MLTVTNNGPSTATQIQVTDQPGGATVTAVSPSGGGFTCGFNTTTNTATCTGGTLSKAAVATITLTVTAPNRDSTVTNSTTVHTKDVDSNLANNLSATVTTTVRAVADVKIDKTAPPEVDAGASFTYMLMVTNNGPSPATFFFNDTATTEIYALSLHDALPIFTCGFNTTTNTATCTGGTLSKAAVATITLTVTA